MQKRKVTMIMPMKKSMPKSLQKFFKARKSAEKAKKKSFKYNGKEYVAKTVTMWKRKSKK